MAWHYYGHFGHDDLLSDKLKTMLFHIQSVYAFENSEGRMKETYKQFQDGWLEVKYGEMG